jgi:hypothetical protein
MGGFGLTGADLRDPQKISAFVDRWGNLVDRIELLWAWSRTIRARHLSVLKAANQDHVNLLEYLRAPRATAEAKIEAFRGLRKAFAIEV